MYRALWCFICEPRQHCKMAVLYGFIFACCIAHTQAYALAPMTGTVSPSDGRSEAQQPIVLSATYIDADGWQNIAEAYVVVNTSSTLTNSCYVMYDQNANKLYIRNDANTGWTGGYAPGSANTISNSYASLNCQTTTVSGTVQILTVKWAIIPKDAMAGLKNVYLRVKDDTNSSTGWIKKGEFYTYRRPVYPE
jgi:hypothetical protein